VATWEDAEMVIEAWQPGRELTRRHAFRGLLDMQKALDEFWNEMPSLELETDGGRWSMALDVLDKDDSIEITASIPGIDPKDIEVTFDDGFLMIKGKTETETEEKSNKYLLRERRKGAFYRSVRISDKVNADKAECRVDNGVLTVSLPKTSESKAKHIKVAAA
jgi:HSP20 family protein